MGEHTGNDVHRCQPFAGAVRHDPKFSLTYQRDPWCWSSTLGFHRSSSPQTRVVLGVSRYAMVGPHAIEPRQALLLGYGIGTSNAMPAPGVSAFVHHFCDIALRITFTDPTVFAEFGRAARYYEWLDAARRPEIHRMVFREAYRAMRPRPQALDRWELMLDSASSGGSASTGDVAWIEARADAVWKQRRSHLGYRDLAAGHALRGMLYGMHGGHSGALVDLFCLALPSEEDATRWLRQIGIAIHTAVVTSQAMEAGPRAARAIMIVEERPRPRM